MPNTRSDRKEERQLTALKNFEKSLEMYKDGLTRWRNKEKTAFCQYTDYNDLYNRYAKKIADTEFQISILKERLKL